MFLTATNSFPPADHYIFLVRQDHLEKYRVEEGEVIFPENKPSNQLTHFTNYRALSGY